MEQKGTNRMHKSFGGIQREREKETKTNHDKQSKRMSKLVIVELHFIANGKKELFEKCGCIKEPVSKAMTDRPTMIRIVHHGYANYNSCIKKPFPNL